MKNNQKRVQAGYLVTWETEYDTKQEKLDTKHDAEEAIMRLEAECDVYNIKVFKLKELKYSSQKVKIYSK